MGRISRLIQMSENCEKILEGKTFLTGEKFGEVKIWGWMEKDFLENGSGQIEFVEEINNPIRTDE